MRRPERESYVWAALSAICLAALIWRPTAADRPFQVAALSFALVATACGGVVSAGRVRLPAAAFALLGWVGWQLVPLPLGGLQSLSPSRFEAVAAALAVGANPWSSLAANPPAAMSGAVILAGLFAVFGLSRAAASASARAAGMLVFALVAAASVEAAIGLEQYLSALHTGENEALARGTFVNRGQFAALLLCALCAGAGLICQLSQVWRRRPEWAVAAAAVAVLLAAGLLASMSRAALAVAVLLAMIATFQIGRRARWAGLAALLIVIAGLGLTTAGDRVGRRFEQLAHDQGDLGRLAIWRDSAPLAGRHALAGVGLGGYEAVFERTSAYFPRKSVDHAHSDWLEAWIELGTLGFLALLASIGVVTIRGLRSEPSALTLGCLAGAAAPLLQGMVDLPLQSPAVAAAVACCLGLAGGSRDSEAVPFSPEPQASACVHGRRGVSWSHPYGRGSVRSVATAVVAVGAVFVGFHPPRTAEEAFARAADAWSSGDVSATRVRLLETMALQPRAPAVWLRLSEIARADGDIESALQLARQARVWEPFTLRTEWALADLELVQGDQNQALDRLALIAQAAPDIRPAAIQALARGGVERQAIEAALGRIDGQAAADYLVFLARNEDPELRPAYQRLVVEQGLQPPPDEAAYIAKRLDQNPVGRMRK